MQGRLINVDQAWEVVLIQLAPFANWDDNKRGAMAAFCVWHRQTHAPIHSSVCDREGKGGAWMGHVRPLIVVLRAACFVWRPFLSATHRAGAPFSGFVSLALNDAMADAGAFMVEYFTHAAITGRGDVMTRVCVYCVCRPCHVAWSIMTWTPATPPLLVLVIGWTRIETDAIYVCQTYHTPPSFHSIIQ